MILSLALSAVRFVKFDHRAAALGYVFPLTSKGGRLTGCSQYVITTMRMLQDVDIASDNILVTKAKVLLDAIFSK